MAAQGSSLRLQRRAAGVAPRLSSASVSQDASTQQSSRRIDKNPGVSQAIAADEGALPTPAEGTGTTFSRFTAFTSPSRHTLIRPARATSGGVCTIWTCRPFAAAFDTRPRSSTVAPTANGSAGAAAGAATARGTRVVRWNGRGAGAGARRTRCVEVPRVRVVNARAARRSAGESKTGAGSGSAHHGTSFGGVGVAAGTASSSSIHIGRSKLVGGMVRGGGSSSAST